MSSSPNHLAKNAVSKNGSANKGKKPVKRASECDQVDPNEGPSKVSGSNSSLDARFVVDNRKGKDRSRSRSSDRRARRVADKSKDKVRSRSRSRSRSSDRRSRRSASPRRSSKRAASPSRDGSAQGKRARRSRSPSRSRRSRSRSRDHRSRGSPQTNKSVDISQKVGCLEQTVRQQWEHQQRQDQRFDRIEQLLTQWSASG